MVNEKVAFYSISLYVYFINISSVFLELNDYFLNLKQVINQDGFDLVSFIRTKYPSLIAKLVQDSQVPQSELISSLRCILCPIGSGLSETKILIDSNVFEGIMEKTSFGHPDAGNNFNAWSCTFWQVKDLNLLGESIGNHFLTNYLIRNAARMILETALKVMKTTAEISTADVEMISSSTNPVVLNLVDDLPMNLMKIESGTGTPKKREKEKERERSSSQKEKNAVNAANINVNISQTIPPQVKISSFFAKLKKPEGIERASGEYFQPFFVKPDVTLAPLNQLRTIKLERKRGPNNCFDDFSFSSVADYWKHFRVQCVQIAFKRQTCLCVGYDGRPVRAVLKLLKFEGNYRPAYLGTWRKTVPNGIVSGRRPFGLIPEVDYDYDSDAEWDEGDDPEGESLSDLDDDEEDDENENEEDELEDATNQSCADSVDVKNNLMPNKFLILSLIILFLYHLSLPSLFSELVGSTRLFVR